MVSGRDVTSTGRSRPGLVLATVSLGAAVVALDGTVVAVANPDIAESLQPSMSALQWVTNAYLLAIAATLVVFGRAADRFSRRWFWLTGIAVFTVASLLIALSGSIEAVIAWRAVQGLAGALVMPAGVGLLREQFEGPALSRAIAVWSGATGLAAAAGPVVAGMLVQSFGWHAVFLINVPIGAVVVVLGFTQLHRAPSATGSGSRLDLPGAVLLAGAMVLLVWGVLQAEHGAAGPSMWGWIAAAFVVGALFVLRQKCAADPLLDLGVFRNRTVPAAAGLVLVAFFVLYGSLFFLTMYMQRIQGASAFEAGLQVLPLTAALALASLTTGRVIARFGPRPPLVVGMALIGIAAFGLSHLSLESTYTGLWPWLICMGLGVGAVSVASTDALVGSVPAELSGVAGGLQQTASQLGGVIGTATLTTLVASGVGAGLGPQLDAAGVDPAARQAALDQTDRVGQGNVPSVPDASASTVDALTRAAHGTFVEALASAMTVTWVLAIVGLVLAVLVRRPAVRERADDVVVVH